jgi:hypothetical protein
MACNRDIFTFMENGRGNNFFVIYFTTLYLRVHSAEFEHESENVRKGNGRDLLLK